MIILDTHLLSEVLRPKPHESVIAWLRSQPMLDLYTTAVCEAEIAHGVALLPTGKRRAALEAAARAMFETKFADRIPSFDSTAAQPRARSAPSSPRAVKPAAPSANSTHRSRRSRGHTAQRWRRGMCTISRGVG